MSTPRSSGPENSQTLVSWKEIAAFLGRAERTVKRWEHDRGLPVHRVPGGERSGVFAYPDEIRAWLLGELGLAPSEPPPVQQSRESAAPLPTAAPAPPPPRTPMAHHPVVEWAGIAAAFLIVAVGTVLFADHSSLIASARARLTAGKSEVHLPAPEAESLYLQGRYQWSLRTADSLSRSVDDYTRAIALDPRYAQAYAGLAESYELLPEYGSVDRSESFERARLAAMHAIELDPRLAAGHRALAFTLFWHNWNAPASDAEFKRALALAPDEPETHHWYSTTLLCRQQYADAIGQADQALRLAPGNPAVAADSAWVRAILPVNRSGSIGALRELARTQPTLVKPSRYLARLELEDQNYPAFLADLRNAAAISQDPDELALVDAASRGWSRGGRIGLLEGMRQVQKDAFDQGRTSGFALAKTDLFLGRTDEALAYFNAAFDRNDYNLMGLPGCNCIAAVAGNPDYAQLLRRIHERMQVDHVAASSDIAGAIPRRLPIPGAR